MDQKQQIEEMAKDLRKAEHWYLDVISADFELDRKKTAENLHHAGYRQQSEVAEEIIEIIDKALAEHESLRQALNILIKKKYVWERGADGEIRLNILTSSAPNQDQTSPVNIHPGEKSK